MLTHFRISQKIRPVWFILLLLLFCASFRNTSAQVNITVNVIPPYSNKLSDYTTDPGKVFITLQNISPDGATLKVYLMGVIRGESGIRIYTRPGYKPPDPITLLPGAVYVVNQQNLGAIFNTAQLVYEGITQRDILRANGLPEDVYTLCIRAYNYNNGQPLSGEEPEGCSAPFSVVSLEPPVIIQPFCHDTIKPLNPQSVLISWTRPPGASLTVQYRFRMIEVLPSQHNPNDAMQTASFPYFYEAVVTGNSLIYGPAQPALVHGKTYAFTVTAFDPMNKQDFRNNGTSEVCSFIYGDEETPFLPMWGEDTGGVKKDIELVPQTTISGKLLCKYPTSPHDPVDLEAALQHYKDKKTIPLPGTPISIPGSDTSSNITGDWSQHSGVNYNVISNISYGITGNVNYNNFGMIYQPPTGIDNGAPTELNEYGLPLLTPMNTKRYIFADTESPENTKPLAGTRVKLVARIAYMTVPGSFGVIPPEYGETSPIMMGLDLDGAFCGEVMKVINTVLDVTETDEYGNYSFSFRAPFFTGPVIGTDIEHTPIYDERIDIMGDIMGGIMQQVVFPGVDLMSNLSSIQGMAGQAPAGGGQQKVMMGGINATNRYGYLSLKIEVENQKFCSPDIDIFAMPGDVLDIPTQMAKLKTYNLMVEVKSDTTPNQLNTPNAPLAGVNITIMRKDEKVHLEHPQIIDYEGQRLDTKKISSNGTFKNVSAGQTNESGRVYFSNLVRHAYINPQYLIALSTRDFEIASTDYDYTLFNYNDIFDQLKTTAENNAKMTVLSRVIYNHQYAAPTEVLFTYQMKPLPPEIKGRVMAMSNIENIGMAGSRTELLNQSSSTKFSNYTSFINGCYGNKEQAQQKTNSAGFYRYENLPVTVNNNGQVDGPYRRVFIKQPGYKAVIIPPIHELPYKLLNGQLKDVKDINLEPVKLLKGFVEDEDGKPVSCYVKSKYSPYYKTQKNFITININNPALSAYQEVFEVPGAEGGNLTQLTITPLSSQYFECDTGILYTNSAAKITVYKRLHRPAIQVKNDHGELLSGVEVEIGGNKGITDDKGMVRLKFAAAADQFILKIMPGKDYAPLQQSINIPVSSTWINFEYVLENARSIKGYVTEKQSSQPVEGALVFAELVSTGGTILYLEAISNASGFYQLEGIPKSLSQLTVHVSKEGNAPSYAGTVKTIVLTTYSKGPVPDHNFFLTRIDGWDLSTLWGFPMIVENFQLLKEIKGNPNRATISGYLIAPPTMSGYTLLQKELKIPFGKITVTKAADEKPVPEDESVILEVLEIPVELGGAYTGYLMNRYVLSVQSSGIGGYGPAGSKKLLLERAASGQDNAFITGQVKLDLASFKTAHDFNGVLYVGDNTTAGKSVVFSSITNAFFKHKRYLFSLNSLMQPVAIRNYRVFGFDASAVLDSATITGSIIRMNTILHTAIPGCKTCGNMDLMIRAGELVIHGNDLKFNQVAGGKLSFDLEKWKVYSQKPYHFDINEEALVLPEVLIVTGQGVDVKLRNMKVRPASLSDGDIEMSGAGLTLGGIATVKLSGTLKPIFNYDYGIGHYRISLVGETNEPAGWVDNLPNTEPKKLAFESIGLLSNNKDALTIGQNFRFYNIIDMYVDQIMSGPGFFKFNGQPEVGIPGYDPPSAVVTYTKVGNKLACEVEPLQGYVTCYGNVEFILDLEKQETSTGKFTAFGNVKIKPGIGETGPPIFLRGFLTKTNSKCELDIIKVDNEKKYKGSVMQEMMAGQNKILIESGLATVKSNKWDTLKYVGLTTDIVGLTDSTGAPNHLTFVVYGGIDVRSSDIQMSNISTPLGNMKLIYNFSDGSMLGTLTMKNIPLGYAYLKQGMAKVRFDQKGYYLVINLQDFSVGPNPGMPGFRGGFIVGSTGSVNPIDIMEIQQGFRKNLPDFAATGLMGLYVIGEKVLVNEVLPLIFADVSAKAGLGVYVNANFIKEAELTVGGYGYVELEGSASWEIPKTGISCGAAVNTELHFDVYGGYKKGKFYLNNCGSVKVKPVVTGSCGMVLNKIGLQTIFDIISNAISIKADFGLNGSDFYMKLTPIASCL